MHLILFSKPGCHLCEGLQEKLEQIQSLTVYVEVRDITTRDDWFQAFQYEIPVLYWAKPDPNGEHSLVLGDSTSDPQSVSMVRLPRLSPRASIRQVEQMLQKSCQESGSK